MALQCNSAIGGGTSGSGGTECNRDCHFVMVQMVAVKVVGVVLGAIENVIVWWYRWWW